MRLVTPVTKAKKPRVRLLPLVVERDDPASGLENVLPAQFGSKARITPQQVLLNVLERVDDLRGVAVVWIDHEGYIDQLWAGTRSLERIGLGHLIIDKAIRVLRGTD